MGQKRQEAVSTMVQPAPLTSGVSRGAQPDGVQADPNAREDGLHVAASETLQNCDEFVPPLARELPSICSASHLPTPDPHFPRQYSFVPVRM